MSAQTGQSIVVEGELTHGTLESRKLAAAREFYENGLGLRSVRHSPPAQLVAGAGDVVVVCVESGARIHEQGLENRWVVLVPEEADVTKAYEAVSRNAAEWGILDISPPVQRDGETVCVVRDADSNWWEVTNRPADYYQQIFERGEAA